MRKTKARQADRDAIVSSLADAYADQQLSAEEYEDRMSRALTARTLAPLNALVEDLQGRPMVGTPPEQSARGAALPAVHPGVAGNGLTSGRPRASRRALLAGALAVLAVGSFVAWQNNAAESTAPVMAAPPVHERNTTDPFTPQGFKQVVAALMADSDPEAYVSLLTLSQGRDGWQGFAVLPVDMDRQRTETWRWPVTPDFEPDKDSYERGRFLRLSDFDVSLVAKAHRRALSLLGSPEVAAERSAHITAPISHTDPTCLSLTVEDEWQTAVTVSYSCVGKLTGHTRSRG